ncbi:leucine-rich repeat domain-containing protein [uncultured Prevotella sp.]|uniref:leucine-rich repeat domain-containing protein n=1 Tax=uncultured Prevotella sp. TaxID=159272 RepID=UPI0027E30EAD|nr:leucine-rich repeat domain-containing protein [uncultured Prevotella sp.]
MMKFLLSKHSRSVFIFALLSLFMCMVAGKASAAELNPVVKIDKTSYTSSGTEVTLRLWMFNWKKMTITTKDYNARFTGDVYLYIDDKEVGKLNEMWGLIAGSNYVLLQEKPGTVGNSSVINLDGTNVGTAQFQDLKSGQTCPYNSNTTENTWRTVDLKLSFNKSFSYYGHKITVKGKWQDQSSGTLVAKDVALDNDINGFVRPVNLSAQPSGDNMVFSWEQEGYNPSASTLGKWIVYKREGDNNVKLGEAAANEHSLSIEKKQYSCSKGYIMTFLPKACEVEETVCGLTTTIAATGHKPNADEICQMCGHSFFRYQTSNGKIVDISNKNFGAKVVAHEVVDGKCVIEFDAPITQIPEYAFNKCDNLTGNLVIPNTVTEIGVSAFSECKNLTGALILPNSVTKIGNGAFRSCSGFTTLKLSETLSVIPDHAFYNCSSLSGKLIIPNSVTTIGNWAFNSCRGFTEGLTIPNSVTTIGNSAFYNCSGFTGDLTISNSVTTIGNSAFYNCYRFTGNLTIPNSVTTIGNSAFYSCERFKGDLTIPNSVTTIGNLAFYNCTGFKGDLTIPNSVTTIGDAAFYNCYGFTGDLSLPKSLEVVGYRSFEYCNNIKTIKFQSLPTGISLYLGGQTKTVSLSDNSFISPKATGTVNAISYTRKMTSDWGTLVLPYSLTLTGSEPYRLYTIEKMNGDELVLKQLDKDVLAGTPCVVKRNGSEAELTFGANDAALNMATEGKNVGDMKFRGTYWTKDVNNGYIIAKDCFWNVADLQNSESVKGVKVKPFRAWLDGTSANAPARLSMRIDDNTTGINATEVLDALNDAEAEYYDLSGKRLDEPQKGVNIVRMKSGKTKKIIIK